MLSFIVVVPNGHQETSKCIQRNQVPIIHISQDILS